MTGQEDRGGHKVVVAITMVITHSQPVITTTSCSSTATAVAAAITIIYCTVRSYLLKASSLLPPIPVIRYQSVEPIP